MCSFSKELYGFAKMRYVFIELLLAVPEALAERLPNRTDFNSTLAATPHRPQRRTDCNAAPTTKPHQPQSSTDCNTALNATPH